MIIPQRLKKGDTIGVVAPSNPIIGENIEEINRAKEIVEKEGFKIKFAKNLFSNSIEYSSTPKEKAEDINGMFADKNIKMIWCAKGGLNSNSVFEYIDYELIKSNPKILCGYSDATSLTNIITEKTGLITFCGTNFKTIATDETNYSYNQVLKRLEKASLEIGERNEEYKTIQKGQAEGKLVGGSLSLIKNLTSGKYKIDFTNKILFIEEFSLEAEPALAHSFLYFMKQNEVFDKIKGLWIGFYEHESGIKLEKIISDVLQLPNKQYQFPIIKSNNFGHTETKTVIPIGTKAKIDTQKSQKIELIEKCVK